MNVNGFLTSPLSSRLTVFFNACSKRRDTTRRLSTFHISYRTGREYFEHSAKFSKLGRAAISELPGPDVAGSAKLMSSMPENCRVLKRIESKQTTRSRAAELSLSDELPQQPRKALVGSSGQRDGRLDSVNEMSNVSYSLQSSPLAVGKHWALYSRR